MSYITHRKVSLYKLRLIYEQCEKVKDRNKSDQHIWSASFDRNGIKHLNQGDIVTIHAVQCKNIVCFYKL
jgi:hypothetical protein